MNNPNESKYNSLFRSVNIVNNSTKNKSTANKVNKKDKKNKMIKNKKANKNTNILYKTQLLMKKIRFTPQKFNTKFKKEKEKKGEFDPRDIMMRFILWWNYGYNNAFRFDDKIFENFCKINILPFFACS